MATMKTKHKEQFWSLNWENSDESVGMKVQIEPRQLLHLMTRLLSDHRTKTIILSKSQ